MTAAGIAPPLVEPLDDRSFARRMQPLAPFEAAPRLAVAVSGGADSLALALLAYGWARARGGRIVALTVDHGLRAEAAAEAARVGAWLAARGIEHHVLRWAGAKPRSGIQAAARAARRELLLGFCRDRRILHLLLGHQQDDQAETLLLRQQAASGRDGLAGMSAIVEAADVRILRPLLDVPHARLCATLTALGQMWIEDPSNRDPRFARSALRDEAPANAALALQARSFAAERLKREHGVAELLARHAAVHPEGWATLDPEALRTAAPEIGRRALVRLLLTVGSGEYAPRGERLDRLYEMIVGDRLAGGRTLAGCQVLPRRGRLLFVREPAAAAGALLLPSAGRYIWDGRFVLAVAGRALPPSLSVQALGAGGWAALVRQRNSLRDLPIPAAARVTLPALCDLDGVREVPHLSYRRQDVDPDSVRVLFRFRPPHGLAGSGFAVSSPSAC